VLCGVRESLGIIAAGAVIFPHVTSYLFLHVLVKALERAVAFSGLLVEWGIALPAVRVPVVPNRVGGGITHGDTSLVAALEAAVCL